MGPCNVIKYHAYVYKGTMKWKYETGGSLESGTTLGSDGTIYIGCQDNYLYAIKSDGKC